MHIRLCSLFATLWTCRRFCESLHAIVHKGHPMLMSTRSCCIHFHSAVFILRSVKLRCALDSIRCCCCCCWIHGQFVLWTPFKVLELFFSTAFRWVTGIYRSPIICRAVHCVWPLVWCGSGIVVIVVVLWWKKKIRLRLFFFVNNFGQLSVDA